jgi:hypothetical protein
MISPAESWSAVDSPEAADATSAGELHGCRAIVWLHTCVNGRTIFPSHVTLCQIFSRALPLVIFFAFSRLVPRPAALPERRLGAARLFPTISPT